MKRLLTIAAVLLLASQADAGCRSRRCKPAANSCQPCQPVANAVAATANVIAAPVRVITGGCAGGVCR